jgi:hypothetical protein
VQYVGVYIDDMWAYAHARYVGVYIACSTRMELLERCLNRALIEP